MVNKKTIKWIIGGGAIIGAGAILYKLFKSKTGDEVIDTNGDRYVIVYESPIFSFLRRTTIGITVSKLYQKFSFNPIRCNAIKLYTLDNLDTEFKSIELRDVYGNVNVVQLNKIVSKNNPVVVDFTIPQNEMEHIRIDGEPIQYFGTTKNKIELLQKIE